MPRVAYTDADKKEIRRRLAEVGLELFSQKGFKNVKLTDILTEVGISKPFFYTFFASKEDLVLHILNYQQEMLFQILTEEMANETIDWEEKVNNFLQKLLYHRKNHLFIMTQEEEVWVYERLKPENYEIFQKEQTKFYQRVLDFLEIPEEKCTPQVFGNLLLSLLLVHNSAVDSMPFLFTEHLEKTAALQSQFLLQYLSALRQVEKGSSCDAK